MKNQSFQQAIRAGENEQAFVWLGKHKAHVCGIHGSVVGEGDDEEFRVTCLLPALQG